MKTVIVMVLTFLSSIATANDKPKREPVPGGYHADAFLYKNWEASIKNARYPLLPEKIPVPDLNGPTESRQRYIMHLDTSKVTVGDAGWDGYNYSFVYRPKGQPMLGLVVPPVYRECFDNLTKKFDRMQWVVYVREVLDLTEEGYGKIIQLGMQLPRQCKGQLKYTGSKLKDAKGEFDQ